MKISTLLFLFLFLAPAWAAAQSCASLNKELARLRTEYRTYADSQSSKTGEKDFEGLAQILDKIVEVKSAMRKSNCKIPPRRTGGEKR